jgi:hypothetical protein
LLHFDSLGHPVTFTFPLLTFEALSNLVAAVAAAAGLSEPIISGNNQSLSIPPT